MIWKVVRTRKFLRAYKRLNAVTKRAVDLESEKIAQNPSLGTRKVGTLSQIYVHKFHFQKIMFLLAYTQDTKIEVLSLEMIGPHEHFYRDLVQQTKKPPISRRLFVHMGYIVEMALIEPSWLQPLQAMYLLSLTRIDIYF